MHYSTACRNVVVYSTLPWMCDWEPTKSIQEQNIILCQGCAIGDLRKVFKERILKSDFSS